jgi:hypothetical protein
MFQKFFTAAAFFCVAVVIGLYAGRTSWNGVIYLSSTSFNGGSRNPAAIRRDLDFSKLSDDELVTASQKRLVTAARVILSHDDVGVELGHFVTRDENGDKKLACDFYDRMTLAFEAEGISEGGEKPQMEIEGPCRVATDITRIEPIWIPVQKILAENAGDMDLSYPGDDETNYRFKDMTSEWPMQWRLKNIRLFNSQEGGRQVSIGTTELSQLTPHPIEVNWTAKTRVPTSENSNP